MFESELRIDNLSIGETLTQSGWVKSEHPESIYCYRRVCSIWRHSLDEWREEYPQIQTIETLEFPQDPEQTKLKDIPYFTLHVSPTVGCPGSIDTFNIDFSNSSARNSNIQSSFRFEAQRPDRALYPLVQHYAQLLQMNPIGPKALESLIQDGFGNLGRINPEVAAQLVSLG